MNYKVILNISKTHLISKKKQSIIAALGVMFGIGTYIILMSFMTGLNGLLDDLILNRTPHIHLFNETEVSQQQPLDYLQEVDNSFNVVASIKPKNSQKRIHNAVPILQYLNNYSLVKGATAQVAAQAFYISGSTQMNALLNGINVMDEVRLYNFEDYIVKGKAKDLAVNSNGIILGIEVAKKLSLDIGDKIQINNIYGDSYTFKIIGFFQSGLADIDKVYSYVNLKTAQQILGQNENYITDINIKMHDMSFAPEFAKTLAAQFKLTAVDIQTANAQFETGTKIRNMISYAVSFTLMLVAGFGIYNILNMMIYEKMNDIAILKAVGFSGNDVKWIFISQAMITGFVGGVVGLIFGFLISLLISHTPFETEALPTIKTFPVNFNPMFYLVGVAFSLLSTFLAAYLPAKKAEKIDPVEIIRGQ
ncbi:MAG: ABC transporter permease [Vicingaceae bacterium]